MIGLLAATGFSQHRAGVELGGEFSHINLSQDLTNVYDPSYVPVYKNAISPSVGAAAFYELDLKEKWIFGVKIPIGYINTHSTFSGPHVGHSEVCCETIVGEVFGYYERQSFKTGLELSVGYRFNKWSVHAGASKIFLLGGKAHRHFESTVEPEYLSHNTPTVRDDYYEDLEITSAWGVKTHVQYDVNDRLSAFCSGFYGLNAFNAGYGNLDLKIKSITLGVRMNVFSSKQSE
jgi:hypothetical protein